MVISGQNVKIGGKYSLSGGLLYHDQTLFRASDGGRDRGLGVFCPTSTTALSFITANKTHHNVNHLLNSRGHGVNVKDNFGTTPI